MDINRNMSNHYANNLRLTDLISKDNLPDTVESRLQVLHETANRVITKGSDLKSNSDVGEWEQLMAAMVTTTITINVIKAIITETTTKENVAI